MNMWLSQLCDCKINFLVLKRKKLKYFAECGKGALGKLLNYPQLDIASHPNTYSAKRT